jgi:hypothetical protein
MAQSRLTPATLRLQTRSAAKRVEEELKVFFFLQAKKKVAAVHF